LKTIPGASPDLIEQAGRYADRLSMNVELPSETSLAAYAPEKSATSIKKGLAATRALDRKHNGCTPGEGRHDRTRRPTAVRSRRAVHPGHRRRRPHR
jgi:predicted DNA-binding helix-hairpin-helix protein